MSEENQIAVSINIKYYNKLKCWQLLCTINTIHLNVFNIIYYVAALWYSKEDNQKDKSMINGVIDGDTDMDDEDGDSEVEGSADQSLEF